MKLLKSFRRGPLGEEIGTILVRRMTYDTLYARRCEYCKKWYMEEERYMTYPYYERPGCPRCSKTGQLVRASKRRTFWLKHVGPQQEPMKFPASISKILYAP